MIPSARREDQPMIRGKPIPCRPKAQKAKAHGDGCDARRSAARLRVGLAVVTLLYNGRWGRAVYPLLGSDPWSTRCDHVRTAIQEARLMAFMLPRRWVPVEIKV